MVRRHARLPVEQLAPYLIPVDPPGPPLEEREAGALPPLEWNEVFRNANPVEIEVGFGKGLFLQTSAMAHPDINYLGIEIERKYCLLAANRIARRGLSNVRLACTDARQFLRDRVQPASVAAVHVYFPDPWWKKRHHKRRVFTDEFARRCEIILVPGGVLHVATDVEEYYHVMLETMKILPTFGPMPPPEEHEPTHDLDYLTNFERKFRQQGKPIYRARFRKTPASA